MPNTNRLIISYALIDTSVDFVTVQK